MSLQAHKAPFDTLEEHVRTCPVLYCDACQTFNERQWQDEYRADERARIETEQLAELDEFERAEVRRDLGLDDNDRSDFCGDDLRCGDLPR